MKKNYLLAGMIAIMLASCSTDEQSGSGPVPGSTVTLNASLPNSGTRVSEASSDTYGLITNWSADDSLDVFVNTNTIVSMTKGNGNTFNATPATSTIAGGFSAGQTIYGVNNKNNDKITTAVNGNQLKATLDFSGQDGTVGNLAKYDLMYGKGDPTGNITFNHKICVMRLDISSDSLKNDGITNITGLKLKYVATSGSKLFASQEVYNLGAVCDSTIIPADSIYVSSASIAVANGKATVYIAVPSQQNLNGTLYINLNGTNGTKDQLYNLTNAISMTNARMRMSTVHPLAIVALSRTKKTATTAKIGDYLFSDGTWGSLADNLGATTLKPIAVIFSTTTSVTDKGKSWIHGYAMALKNASAGTTWSTTGATTNPTGQYYTDPAAIIADKDGYTHSTFINSSVYPAGYAATTTYNTIVTAPSNTSGWYLPSVGQWYDICVNLGEIATSYLGSSGLVYWRAQSSTCVNNINSYLTPLISGTYDAFLWNASSNYNYCSSSECNSTDIFFMGFYGDLNLSLDSRNSLRGGSLIVRPVIAF